MQQILIALDAEPMAAQMAAKAYQWAKSLGAGLTLVHVLPDSSFHMPLDYSPVMGYSGVPTEEMIQPTQDKVIRESALQHLENIRHQLGDSSIECRVLEGDAAATIIKESTEGGYSLIIIGNHKKSGLEEALLGSVTRQVLKLSELPVLVISSNP